MRARRIQLIALTIAAGLVASGAYAATLAVTGAAALEGSFGLEVQFAGDTALAYVQDDTPAAETVYRAIWRMDVTNEVHPGGRYTVLFGRGGSPQTGTVRIEVVRKAGADGLGIKCFVKKNNGNFVKANSESTNGFIDIADNAPVQILYEVEFGASGAGSLHCENVTTGAFQDNVSINNNFYDVELVRFGAARQVNMQLITGTLYLDDFQSFRTLAP